MKFAYFPGCSLESTSWEFDASTRSVFRELQIELEEIPDWVCCGSTPAHSTNASLAIGLSVLNLQKAEAMRLPMMTACSACYSRLRTANHKVRIHSEMRAEAERVTGHPYAGSVDVLHVLDVLVNRLGEDFIRSKVRRPLMGLKVASYYGCLLSRPPDIATFEDPEHPISMDRLVAAAGADPVDWPYKTECCGASLSMTNTEVVCRLGHKIISMAREAGADCIAVACPMCQVNLDLRQADAVRAYGDLPPTPVLFITQLLGLALGLTPKDLGLSALSVNPIRLLEKFTAEPSLLGGDAA